MPRLKLKGSPLILYTLGDPAGVGAEILITALSKRKFLSSAIHVVIGDKKILKRAKKISTSSLNFYITNKFDPKVFQKGLLNIIDLSNASRVSPGSPSKSSGKASWEYLELASRVINNNTKSIKALITLPVSKKYIQLVNKRFQGHTEYLKEKFKVRNVEMIFITPDFELLLYTRHIPLKDIPKYIHKRRLAETIFRVEKFYRQRLGIIPEIAVLGLNPHAGEGGIIGMEEEEVIIPVIKQLQRKSLKIDGPFPGDSFFRNSRRYNYRLVVSLYHDQALPVIKTLYKSSVNFTLGLPFLRFSPDHGTAFDIAGRGIADSSSLESAIQYALRFPVLKSRK